MKRIIIAIGAITIFSTVAFCETPRVDQRQVNQSKRIEQGIANGRLNARETNIVQAQQNNISTHETRVKSDGIVTKRERINLHRHQNRANRTIKRAKHNRR